jgi:hypothetical protein
VRSRASDRRAAGGSRGPEDALARRLSVPHPIVLVLGGALPDVTAPLPGELFSETNDNSVAILLTYGTARVLLAGDAEAKEEEYMANGLYTRS